MIWAVDSQLEEILADAKSAIATFAEQDNSKAKDSKDSPAKAPAAKVIKIKQHAEQDKETLTDIVRTFLVSTFRSLPWSLDLQACRLPASSLLLCAEND
jgi:hypothetical protein